MSRISPWGDSKPGIGAVLDHNDPINKFLRLAWLFNEGSGGGITDLTRGLKAPLVAAPAWVPGRVSGSALKFNGSSQYATVDSTYADIGPLNFSFAAWIRLSALGGYSAIIDRRVTGPPAVGYLWGYRDGDASHKMALFMAAADSTSGEVLGTTALVAGTWYHIGVTVTRGGNTIHYINGHQDASGSNAGVTAASSLSNAGVGSIAYRTAAIASAWTYFPGSISQVRQWYGRVLTPSDMMRLYNQPFAGVYVPRSAKLFSIPDAVGGFKGAWVRRQTRTIGTGVI